MTEFVCVCDRLYDHISVYCISVCVIISNTILMFRIIHNPSAVMISVH